MTVDSEVITPEALSIVSSEGCIVYPTSTQPALGCLPTRTALDGLYAIKNRPSHMPVSIGVADLEQASNLVELTDDIPDLLASFPEGSQLWYFQQRRLLIIGLGPIESLSESCLTLWQKHYCEP